MVSHSNKVNYALKPKTKYPNQIIIISVIIVTAIDNIGDRNQSK